MVDVCSPFIGKLVLPGVSKEANRRKKIWYLYIRWQRNPSVSFWRVFVETIFMGEKDFDRKKYLNLTLLW